MDYVIFWNLAKPLRVAQPNSIFVAIVDVSLEDCNITTPLYTRKKSSYKLVFTRMETSSSPKFVITTSSVDNSSSKDVKTSLLHLGSEDFSQKNGLGLSVSTASTSSEDGKDSPRPIGREDLKNNEEYARKRMRNNMAVKKSRDRSKKRIMETQERVEQLTRENTELNQKVTLLSKELNVLRALFTNGGFTVPCNLQIVAQNPVSPNRPSEDPTNGSNSPGPLMKMVPQNPHSPPTMISHTSVIRSTPNTPPCHGMILVTEPGKLNLDIQAGIQFKDESK